LHSSAHAGEASIPTGKDHVAVELVANVVIAVANGVVDALTRPAHIKSVEVGIKHRLCALKPLAAHSDCSPIWEFKLFIARCLLATAVELLFIIYRYERQLFLDFGYNLIRLCFCSTQLVTFFCEQFR
jgi:hypothetical protein